MTRSILALALLLAASAAAAESRCDARRSGGGDAVTSCRDGSGEAKQLRTRDAVGGRTITTGNGMTCTSHPAVGGGTIMVCR